MKNIVIATRGSKLALWQAEHIKSCLEAAHSGMLRVSLLVLKTKGDIILDVPLAKVGGKGLFVKEIEEALLDGRADIAVHSMKDVPMELPAGLTLGVCPKREDPTDCLLSVQYPNLAALPQGASVGTSSLRRQSQLLALRPDLKILSLRGNVDTRLRKLMDGAFDAIVMATAGLRRLALQAPHMEMLDVTHFLPAVGQGALGIEFAAERDDLQHLLAFLDDPATRICVAAERGFLAGLEGGCQVPIAGHAIMTGKDSFRLEGLVSDVHGTRCIRQTIQGKVTEARELGFALAASVKQAGGAEILAELYGSTSSK